LGDGAGSSGILDLGGNTLTAGDLFLGMGGIATVTRTGGGTLQVTSTAILYGSDLSLGASDVVATLVLHAGTALSTAATGNITNRLILGSGSTLTLGAGLSASTNQLSGNVDARGYTISAQNLTLSGPYMISNRGAIQAYTLNLYPNPGQPAFVMSGADSVHSLVANGVSTSLSNGVSVQYVDLESSGGMSSNLTVSSTYGIAAGAFIGAGSTLTLASELRMSMYSTVNLNGTLNANGFRLSAGTINLGQYGGPFALVNRGPIDATNLNVFPQGNGSTMFDLTPVDSVGTLNLYGTGAIIQPGARLASGLYLGSSVTAPPTFSSCTTSSPDNLTHAYVGVGAGCTLNLGADLQAYFLDLSSGANLVANGHSISSGIVLRGVTAAIFRDLGALNAYSFEEQTGSQVELKHPGDTLGSLLLSGNSVLTFRDADGQTAGVTIVYPTANYVSIESGSDLILELNGLAGGWIFRWANPAGGDHLADLQGLIAGNEIIFSSLNGGSYSLSADSAYTYINVVPVPEPSALILTAAVGLLAGVRRIRKSAS
jgi:hypothetical protein